MAEVLMVGEREFYPVYWRYRLPYDEAKLDAVSYWNMVAADLNCGITEAQIERLSRIDVESWSRPGPVMPEWASKLRGAGMRTAILSNLPMDLRVHLTSAVKWLPEFDEMTFSCDVRMVKPQPGIYEHCLGALGVAAGDALFLDDRPENVEAAQKLGIHAIQFTTPQAAVVALDGHFHLPVPIGC